MATGTIVRVKLESGYGFVRKDTGGDIFLHVKDLRPDLIWSEELQERRVEFDIQATDRGPRAVNVKGV